MGIEKGIGRDLEITSRRRGCKRRGVVEGEGGREGWVDRKGRGSGAVWVEEGG